jgi:hypothetical protein
MFGRVGDFRRAAGRYGKPATNFTTLSARHNSKLVAESHTIA